MGLQKDILETEVRFTSNQAMAELKKIESTTANLRRENDRLAVTKAKMEALGKKESEEYKKITAQMSANSKAIKENKSTMESLRKVVGLSALSMTDLRKRASGLTQQLNSMSKSANPAEYNRLEKELLQVRKQMDSLQGGTKKTGALLRGMGELLPIASIGAAVAALGAMAKELFNLSKRMQAEDRKAMIVLGDSMGYVEDQADKLARKIGVTRHEFTSMVTNTTDLLVPLDFTRKKAAEMAVQVQSLAGAMDEWTGGQYGVAEASDTLNTAMLGEMERLKTYGIAIRQDSEEFRNLVKQKKADRAATDEQAKALATLELILKKSRDAQTSFAGEGNKLMRWQKEVSRWWRQIKENVVGYFDTHPSEKIRQEKEVVNQLVYQLMDANTQESTRKEILEKIKDLAPDIFRSITEEGKATTTTSEALRDYNRNMVERIILAEKQLEYEEKAKKQAKTTGNRKELEDKLRGEISSRIEAVKDEQKQMELRAIMLNGELSLLQKTTELKKAGLIIDMQSADQNTTTRLISQYTQLQDPLIGAIERYKELLLAEREQKWTVDDLYKDMEEKKASMGMLMSGPWAPGYDPNSGSGDGGKKSEEEQKKAYQKDLALTQDYITNKQNLLKESYLSGKITQEEYAGELLTLEFDSLQARLNLSKKYNIDVAETGKELLDQHIKIKEKQAELVDQITKDLVKSLQESDKDADAALSKLLEKNVTDLSDDQNLFGPNEGDKESLLWQESYKGQLGLLAQHLRDKEILQSEYNEKVKKLDQEQLSKKLEGLTTWAESSKGVLDVVSLFQEAAMNRELAAAGDNTKKREAIEKKYNEKKKKWAIAQTIIEGILEIAKIWSSIGAINPAQAIVQSIIAVGRTAGEVAAISAQKYDKGGYTAPGPWDQPQGVVHSEEFVANRHAVRNPAVRQFLDVFDLAQRSGQIRSLNTQAILRAVEGRRGGYAGGGYSPSGQQSLPPVVVGTDPELKAIIAQNNMIMAELHIQLKKGFRGNIVYSDIERASDELATIRKSVTLG